MQDWTIEKFLQELSSGKATPGGGSTAALVGALGSGLVQMTNNLTIGREAYKLVEEEMQSGLTAAIQLQQEMTGLIQEDIDAFNSLMACYRLPKETEEQRDKRHRAIQDALQKAAEVPLQIARRSVDLLKLAQVSAAKGNKNAVSDGVSGALLAYSVLQIGVLNIKVNVDLLKDALVAAELIGEARNLLWEGKRILDEITENSDLQAYYERG